MRRSKCSTMMVHDHGLVSLCEEPWPVLCLIVKHAAITLQLFGVHDITLAASFVITALAGGCCEEILGGVGWHNINAVVTQPA